MQDKEALKITFRSLSNKDAEFTIKSDLRVNEKNAILQTVKQKFEIEETLPQEFRLSQNYPNPFNPNTNIHFELAEPSDVVLDVYDILGRKVESLINQNDLRAGYYKASWDASRYASGMYIYVLNINSKAGKHHTFTKKMMLIK